MIQKQMTKYIGTKIVYGEPMSLEEYNIYRGWDMPLNEEPGTPGYLVEYTDGGPTRYYHGPDSIIRVVCKGTCKPWTVIKIIDNSVANKIIHRTSR